MLPYKRFCLRWPERGDDDDDDADVDMNLGVNEIQFADPRAKIGRS